MDGTGSAARFSGPRDVAVAPDGYIFVADYGNCRVRRVSPAGVVTTVAGMGSSTRVDGPGNVSGHQYDIGVAVGASGDLYLAETVCIRMIERIIGIGDTG